MKIELYYAPITCAMAPYITLTEVGADFEVKPLNFRAQQHLSFDYIKLNPKHKVPLLVVNGERLTENVAIQLWISRNFPSGKILPTTLWEEAQAISLLSWFSGGIHPYLTRINAPPKVCSIADTEANVRNNAVDSLHEQFEIANQFLMDKDYFLNDFSAPDAHFFWCTRRAKQFKIDLSNYVNVISHFERMQNRESVQKLLAFEKETIENFKSTAKVYT